MDTERNPDDGVLRLNALVDGELAPAERAEMASRLASDRDFARAYATLALLKATTVSTAESMPVPVTGAPGRLPGPNAGWRALGIAAAAAAIGGVLFLAGLYAISDRDRKPGADQAVITLAGLPFSPAVPDLAAVGLSLAGVAVEASENRPAVVATYRGPRGCRLELRIRETNGTDVTANEAGRRAWLVGNIFYEFRSFGMPTQRFAAIAQVAEYIARDGHIPSDDRRMRVARLPSAPCVG